MEELHKEENTKEDTITLEKKMRISDFHVIRKLREGNFAKLYACWNAKTQKIYAIKVLDRANIERLQLIQYVMNEQEILRTVPKSPFIVNFYKLIKDTNFVYFIMDYIEGEDLFDVITKLGSFSPEHSRFLVSQILLIMEHMHNSKIIYRDLKPENLMINPDGYLTLVDMGAAKRLKIEREFRTRTIIGTTHYMAPEVIMGKGYSFPVDLWALGIISYELLYGKLPFGQAEEDPYTIYEQIINSKVKYPRNCSKSSKELIEKLLSANPQHRSEYQELKNHPFFEGLDWNSIVSKTAETFYKPSQNAKIKPAELQSTLSNEKNKAPSRFLVDKSVR